MLNVEVIYSASDQTIFQVYLTLNEGAIIADALEKSGVLQQYPETVNAKVGIFAKIRDRNTLLQAGDRIELYRDLTLDPKQKRRERAKSKS